MAHSTLDRFSHFDFCLGHQNCSVAGILDLFSGQLVELEVLLLGLALAEQDLLLTWSHFPDLADSDILSDHRGCLFYQGFWYDFLLLLFPRAYTQLWSAVFPEPGLLDFGTIGGPALDWPYLLRGLYSTRRVGWRVEVGEVGADDVSVLFTSEFGAYSQLW